MFTFYEFFAGGGMVRQGLGADWQCVFANDYDGKKALAYQENWGVAGELHVKSIDNIDGKDLARPAHLAWGSFPCQDLSIAGTRAGLAGKRSGLFYEFWRVILSSKYELPELVVVENVCGLLTSNGGRDFEDVVKSFVQNGYCVGAIIVDASLFNPQSRPRLFFVGVRKDLDIDPNFVLASQDDRFHGRRISQAFDQLSNDLKSNWLWWNLAEPKPRNISLRDIIEPIQTDDWFSAAATNKILAQMTDLHRAKICAAGRLPYESYGAAFKRTRTVEKKRKVCVEVRFDGIAGCLRTPNGGSSRQILISVNGNKVRSRLFTPREAARLMGLPDSYRLPKNNNAALHLCGDGVSVDVVAHLKDQLFQPILNSNFRREPHSVLDRRTARTGLK